MFFLCVSLLCLVEDFALLFSFMSVFLFQVLVVSLFPVSC